MNTSGIEHNGTNTLLYIMTMVGTWATDNWYLILMVVFGAIHALVAWQRNKREKELHLIKVNNIKRE